MPSRAMRVVVSLSMLTVLLGASIAQAAPGDPGSPFDTPPGQVISGKLSIVHGDSFEFSGHSHAAGSDHVLPDLSYWLQTDTGEELLLEFAGEPPVATPETYYEVRGERHGRAFHVAEMKEQAAKPTGGGSGKGGPKTQTPTAYVGQRDMLVIPFTFAGNSAQLTDTTGTIRDRGFGARSVRTFYEESSATTTPGLTFKGKNDGTTLDKDGLPGDVTETFSISGLATDRCDYTAWATAARNAATAAGWDLTGYEHIVYLHPRLTKLEGAKEVSICGWSGLAQIGGAYSWLNGTISLGIWAHEIGHNLTLYHSRTAICSTADGVFISVASSCSFDEYGDPFDTMGQTSTPRQFNGRNKPHLGWFPSANITTAVSGQTYTLRPIESATTGVQVLQIPRGRDYLYVDYRRPTGTFDNYGPADDVVNGVLIHSGPAIASNGNSYLFDTAIYPLATKTNISTGEQTIVPDFSDAALNVGEGFVDVSGVYIETLSVNADGTITVLVQTGVSNSVPVLTGFSGGVVALPTVPHTAPTASLTDANKNLGRYRWSFVSCPATCPQLTGTDGALSGGSDSAPGPTYVPVEPGTYDLKLEVWDTSGALKSVILRETVGLI